VHRHIVVEESDERFFQHLRIEIQGIFVKAHLIFIQMAVRKKVLQIIME
jgi:hypothetical protein